MSGRSHYLGIPREKIPWYPVINPDLCTNCGACINFCANEVFSPGDSSPEVINPMNCVVGCSACARNHQKFAGLAAGADSFNTQSFVAPKG